MRHQLVLRKCFWLPGNAWWHFVSISEPFTFVWHRFESWSGLWIVTLQDSRWQKSAHLWWRRWSWRWKWIFCGPSLGFAFLPLPSSSSSVSSLSRFRLVWQRDEDIDVVEREESRLVVQHTLVPVLVDLIGQGDDIALSEAQLSLVLWIKVVQRLTARLLGGWGNQVEKLQNEGQMRKTPKNTEYQII